MTHAVSQSGFAEVVEAPPFPPDEVVYLPAGLALSCGGRLPEVRIAYRLTGPAGAPVVAVLGGISADRQVMRVGDTPGWWDTLVGEGCGVDPRGYRVLSLDYLGGRGDSTAPSDARCAPKPFPSISTADQADALAAVLDRLGVQQLHAIIGASYGGMVALAFGARHPQRISRLVVISDAHVSDPMATAWRSVQRAIVRFGLQQGAATEALALSRGLAMATYRSREEFGKRFGTVPTRTAEGFRFPVEEYLFARGESFARQVAPEIFLCLSESIDLHRVDPGAVKAFTTLVAVRQDQLVPIEQMWALAEQLGGDGTWVEIDSLYGHDAFLKEDRLLAPVVIEALGGDPS